VPVDVEIFESGTKVRGPCAKATPARCALRARRRRGRRSPDRPVSASNRGAAQPDRM